MQGAASGPMQAPRTGPPRPQLVRTRSRGRPWGAALCRQQSAAAARRAMRSALAWQGAAASAAPRRADLAHSRQAAGADSKQTWTAAGQSHPWLLPRRGRQRARLRRPAGGLCQRSGARAPWPRRSGCLRRRVCVACVQTVLYVQGRRACVAAERPCVHSARRQRRRAWPHVAQVCSCALTSGAQERVRSLQRDSRNVRIGAVAARCNVPECAQRRGVDLASSPVGLARCGGLQRVEGAPGGRQHVRRPPAAAQHRDNLLQRGVEARRAARAAGQSEGAAAPGPRAAQHGARAARDRAPQGRHVPRPLCTSAETPGRAPSVQALRPGLCEGGRGRPIWGRGRQRRLGVELLLGYQIISTGAKRRVGDAWSSGGTRRSVRAAAPRPCSNSKRWRPPCARQPWPALTIHHHHSTD